MNIRSKSNNRFLGTNNKAARLAQDGTLRDVERILEDIAIDAGDAADSLNAIEVDVSSIDDKMTALAYDLQRELAEYKLWDYYGFTNESQQDMIGNENLFWNIDQQETSTFNTVSGGAADGGLEIESQTIGVDPAVLAITANYELPQYSDILTKFTIMTHDSMTFPINVNAGFLVDAVQDTELFDTTEEARGAYWNIRHNDLVDPLNIMFAYFPTGSAITDLPMTSFDVDTLDGNGPSGIDLSGNKFACKQLTLYVERLSNQFRFMIEDDNGVIKLVNSRMNNDTLNFGRAPRVSWKPFIRIWSNSTWDSGDASNFQFGSIEVYRKHPPAPGRLFSWTHNPNITLTASVQTNIFSTDLQKMVTFQYLGWEPVVPQYFRYFLSVGIDHIIKVYWIHNADDVTVSTSNDLIGMLHLRGEATLTLGNWTLIYQELKSANENKYELDLRSIDFEKWLKQVNTENEKAAVMVEINNLEAVESVMTYGVLNWYQ